jgi:Rrf2 family protein
MTLKGSGSNLDRASVEAIGRESLPELLHCSGNHEKSHDLLFPQPDQSSSLYFMQLSMRTDYALRALFTLVEHRGGPPIPILELARRNDVPKRFLEHIMLDLKEKGWVVSTAGKRGGYQLAKNPEKITMGEVVRHFDGYLAPIACVSVSDYKRCTQETTCRFRRVMLTARNLVANLMDRTSLADVMKSPVVSPDELRRIQGIDGEGI